MVHSLVGPLPKHLYCYADQRFFRRDKSGFEPVMWLGLVSFPGRCWGCTVMTEEGAIYRNLPPHAIAFREDGVPNWTPDDAQRWNCYGTDFTALIYPTLAELKCRVKTAGITIPGFYLFTVAPVGDAYSDAPDQAKEFTFVELVNGRLAVMPTNNVLFADASFTRPKAKWPTDLTRQKGIYFSNEGRADDLEDC